MHGSSAEFIHDAATPLGFYYLILCAMNWGAAAWLWRRGPTTKFHFLGLPVSDMVIWLVVGGAFFVMAPMAMIEQPFPLWHFVPWLGKGWLWVVGQVDRWSGPVSLTVGSLALLTILFLGRRFFVSLSTKLR